MHLLLLLLLPVTSAFPQDVSVHETGSADPILRGPTAATAGTSLDQGDVGGGANRRDLIIGSPGSNNVGRVSIFFGAAGNSSGVIDLTPANANATLEGSIAGSRFGTATASGYIFNVQASGVERDVVVGAPGSTSTAGYVYVFTGPIAFGTRSATTAAITIVGGVGEPARYHGGDCRSQWGRLSRGHRRRARCRRVLRSSRVYVFNLRDRPTWDNLPRWTWLSVIGRRPVRRPRDRRGRRADRCGLGEVIESGGDITGDGIYDLAIGLPRAYGARGAVAVVRGHAAAEGWTFPGTQYLLTATSVLLRGTDVGDRAGASLTFRDVVSSDTSGIRDLVIGAPGPDGAGNARVDSGEVYVIWGSLCPAAMPCQRPLSQPDVVMYGARPNMRTGERVTGGDLNRDNPDDLVLLAPGGSLAELDVIYGTRTHADIVRREWLDAGTVGRLQRRWHRRSGLATGRHQECGGLVHGRRRPEPDGVVELGGGQRRSGVENRAARDFNGDGQPDLVWQNDASRQVSVWFMSGPQGDRNTGWAWLAASPVTGWTLAGVGDFNQDGYNDLVWQNDQTRQVSVWYWVAPVRRSWTGMAQPQRGARLARRRGRGSQWRSDDGSRLAERRRSQRLGLVHGGGARGAAFQGSRMLTTFSVAGWTLSVR